jgi:hypothetical protein
MRKTAVKPLCWLLFILLSSHAGFGQQFFYHLLGQALPIVDFTTSAITMSETDGIFAPWASTLSAWSKRRKIEFTGVGSALTNFPVLVLLDSTRITYGQTKAGGADLRFTDNSGNVIPHEISVWDNTGTSIVWVKVPTLAASPAKTNIWMYYGNAAASDGQDVANTWDTNFKKVMHFNGTLGAVANGASVSATVGSAGSAGNAGGTGLSYAAGVAGNGFSLDGTDDWINIGADASLNFAANTAFTASVFFKTSDSAGPILNFRSSSSGAPIFGLHLNYNGATYNSGKASMIIRDDGNNTYSQIIGPTINDGAWHLYTVTRNAGSTVELFIDGVSYGTVSTAASGGAITTDYRALGSDRRWIQDGVNSTDERYFAGSIDELQFSNAQRSAAWNLATYQSAMDMMAFYFNEESPTASLVTITAQLNSTSGQTVTVPFTVSGTATAGSDHSASNANITISPGSLTGTYTFSILRDEVVESSEDAVITMGNPTNATKGTTITVHTTTITDEALFPPDAIDDGYTLTTLSQQTFNVISNDTDANADTIRITAVSTPVNGGTAVLRNNRIVFTPNTDFAATDSFTYTVSDGRGGTDTATVTVTYQIPFTWTGNGSDANWTTAGNWQGGVVPGSGNIAYFNNSCTTVCDPVQTANISIGGVRINSSYTGTIAQATGFTWTIGNSGWTQRAGTFTGANANITVGNYGTSGGIFTLIGGTFNSTTAILSLRAGTSMSAPAVFNHSNGQVTVYTSITSHKFGAGDLYKLTIQTSDWTAFDFQSTNFTVLNDLTLNGPAGCGGFCTMNNATIDAKGNVYVVTDGYRGTAIVRVSGAANQSIDGTSASSVGSIPNLQIISTGGTVSLVSTVNVNGSYTYTSGTLDAGTSTLAFIGNGQTIVPGTPTYNHVTFSATGWAAKSLSAGTMTVAGNLTLAAPAGCGTNCALNSGTLNVSGNLVIQNDGFQGSSVINLVGASNTTISAFTATRLPTTTLTVNKSTTATAVTLLGAVGLGASQSLTITQGTVNMAGFNLSVGGTLTIASAGKLLCNGGTPTYGTIAVNGEISCGPSVGITWTGAAGDNLWSTAGNWSNSDIPGASDIARFTSICSGANCNSNMPATVSIKGMIMQSGYTGTVTAGATSLAIGTSGWTQAAGTFSGASAAMNLNTGAFSLTGGTFTSTSATMALANANWSITGSPTFNHNSGTVSFTTNYSSSMSMTVGTVAYNNVTFNSARTTYNITGSMTVNGTLTMNDTSDTSGGIINTGTILAYGNIVFTNYGCGGSGTGILRVAGSTNQTVTGVASARIPKFEIASTGGTVTLAGTLQFYSSSYTYTSGTVDATASTLLFASGYAQTTTIVPGNIEYNNVTFSGFYTAYALTGTLRVNGLLSITDTDPGSGRINTGTVLAKGDVSLSGYGAGAGSGFLKIGGSGNQTITGVSSAWIPIYEVASTGGTVTYAGSLAFRNNYTYTSGTIDAGTSTVIFIQGYTQTTTVIPGAPAFNNVTFSGNASTNNLTGTMTVNGNLILDDSNGSSGSINGGTILANGNVTATNYGKIGTVALRVVGSGNQTITGVSTASFPQTEIASTGGTVALSGTVKFVKNYTFTSGTLDAGTSTVQFGLGYLVSATITPGTVSYYNVTFSGNASTHILSGTLTANGTTTLDDANSSAGPVTGGTIEAYGNLTYSGYGKSGTAVVSMLGVSSSDLTMSSTAFRPNGSITINKTGGSTVTMQSDVSFGTAGQDLTLTSGTLDLNGYDLTITDVLTVSSFTTVNCNGGEVFYGSISNSGTVNCPGFAGYPYNWTGAAADGNWSTAGNWSGGAVPGATALPIFDNAYCGANCNVTLDTNINVKGMSLASGYSGTITQPSGITMTLGTKGWKQYGGTFAGGNSAITNTGTWTMSGGTFTSTSGTFLHRGNVNKTGGTFNANGGTVQFSPPYNVTRTLALGTTTFNNLEIMSAFAYDGFTINATGTATVNGAFVIRDTGGGTCSTLSGGTFNLKGNASFVAGGGCTVMVTNNTNIYVNGTGNQLITSDIATRGFGNLEIASTGGTVTLQSPFYNMGGFKYTSGAVSMPTDFYEGARWGATPVFNSGSLQFVNLNFVSQNNYDGFTITTTGTTLVNGNLSFSQLGGTAPTMNSGTIDVQGNVSATGTGAAWLGTTGISMTGTAATTLNIAASSSIPRGSITVNKTGAGSVTQTSAITLAGATQDLTLTAGIYNMGGYNLSVGRNVVNTAGTFKRGTEPTCGTHTVTGTWTGNPSYCANRNVALATYSGVASASSTYNVNFPTTAVTNGDRTGTGWGSGGGWNDNTMYAYPDWLQVNFATSTLISEINVFTVQDNSGSPSTPTLAMTFANSGITNFSVQYWNGSSWVDVTGSPVTGNNKVWRQFTFTPVATDRIRVTVTATAGANDFSRIVELEAVSPP